MKTYAPRPMLRVVRIGEPLTFDPDDRQEAFRRLAVECSEAGMLALRDWLKASAEPERVAFHKVLVSEWGNWCSIPGFRGWFYDSIVDAMPTTAEDRRLLESAVWRQVTKAVTKGEPWACNLAVKMLGLDGLRDVQAGAAELRAVLARTGAHKWPKLAGA